MFQKSEKTKNLPDVLRKSPNRQKSEMKYC